MELKTQRRWVFSPLDLIIPIGVGLGAAALCVLGFLKAQDTAARFVCSTTGFFFLLGIPAWYFVRSVKRKYHLQLRGAYLVFGKLNHPGHADVEQWIDGLEEHWYRVTWASGGKSKRAPDGAVSKALDGLTVFFLDEEKLSIMGRLVRGYAWGRDCVLGYRSKDPRYTESLFRHEVSHQILAQSGESWNEKRHHAIFQITQLGA